MAAAQHINLLGAGTAQLRGVCRSTAAAAAMLRAAVTQKSEMNAAHARSVQAFLTKHMQRNQAGSSDLSGPQATSCKHVREAGSLARTAPCYTHRLVKGTCR